MELVPRGDQVETNANVIHQARGSAQTAHKVRSNRLLLSQTDTVLAEHPFVPLSFIFAICRESLHGFSLSIRWTLLLSSRCELLLHMSSRLHWGELPNSSKGTHGTLFESELLAGRCLSEWWYLSTGRQARHVCMSTSLSRSQLRVA